MDEIATIVTHRCREALANNAVEDPLHRVIGIVRMLRIHFLLDVASDLLVLFVLGEGGACDFLGRLHTDDDDNDDDRAGPHAHACT